MAIADPSTKPLIVAIDGPSGAGKGTVAREVAARLRYRHVDTGAMYRALAWAALQASVDLEDGPALASLAREVGIDVGDGVARVDGQDVSVAIRTPEMDASAAAVARQPLVREILIEQQRALGRAGGVVMEGRDIGTVVFPAADVKVFLDATPEERARRRARDPLHTAGGSAPIDVVATALEARDLIDRTRAASPLTQAADATHIDTTRLSIAEVVEVILQLVQSRQDST